MSRIDRARYDASVVVAVGRERRPQARAGRVRRSRVIDEPDDAAAVAALAGHLARVRPDVVHTHMYRADVVGTKAVLALAERGHPRPYVVSTVHSSRVRSAEDRELLRGLTPDDGPADRGLAGDRAPRSPTSGRASPRSASSTTASTSSATTTRNRAARSARSTGWSPASQIVGVVARLEPEKGHQTLHRGLAARPARVPGRLPPDRRRGVAARRARAPGRGEPGRPSGRLHRPPRRHPGGHRRARRRGPAVLPRGPGPDDPRGDGAVAAGRRVGRRRDPRDGRGRRDRPPRPARQPGPWPPRSSGCSRTTPFADTLARAGHDLVHDRFCIELMVNAIEEIYDEGARASASRGSPRADPSRSGPSGWCAPATAARTIAR